MSGATPKTPELGEGEEGPRRKRNVSFEQDAKEGFRSSSSHSEGSAPHPPEAPETSDRKASSSDSSQGRKSSGSDSSPGRKVSGSDANTGRKVSTSESRPSIIEQENLVHISPPVHQILQLSFKRLSSEESSLKAPGSNEIASVVAASDGSSSEAKVGTERKQSTGGMERKVSIAGTERKQSTVGTERKASIVGTERKQSTVGTERKQSSVVMERKQSFEKQEQIMVDYSVSSSVTKESKAAAASPTEPIKRRLSKEPEGGGTQQSKAGLESVPEVESNTSETDETRSRRNSKGFDRRSKRKSSLAKEIVGTIEKKKGPNLPDKLGFGSSEDRKALQVETLKEKKKSMVAPKLEPTEVPTSPEKKKSLPMGMGFGSSEKRKTAFDKTKGKKKSVMYSNENEKDMIEAKLGSSLKNEKTTVTLEAQDTTTRQDKDTRSTRYDDNVEGENQQPGREDPDQPETTILREEVKKETEGTDLTAHFVDLPPSYSSPEPDDDSEDIPRPREPRFGRDRAPSIYYERPVVDPVDETKYNDFENEAVSIHARDRESSIYFESPPFVSRQRSVQLEEEEEPPPIAFYDRGRAPSIDSIPLDDNEALTSTLLAGKDDEPLRNELENWLSSAINRVEFNLSSIWADPVLRKDSSPSKLSPRKSYAPTRTPRNTLVGGSLSSSTTTKNSIQCSALSSSKAMRRLSDLTINILDGTLSDENKVLLPIEVMDQNVSSSTPELQGSSQRGTPRRMGKTRSEEEEEERSHWIAHETAEEGLRRLQREVEQRAFATYAAKKSPRLYLPDTIRKRKKPAESVAASDYMHSDSGRGHVHLRLTLTKDLLCKQGGNDIPCSLRVAGLSGLNITSVEDRDMELFDNLQILDFSENRINMEDLSGLSQLRKLNLMSNQICHLRLLQGQFDQLQALDLSYNILGGSAIVDLSKLPALETLNVDHNSIVEIPEGVGDQCSFQRLKILSAAYNFMKSPSLEPLSKLPRLQKLLLSHNGISGIPEQIKADVDAFPRLEVLDLTNNKIMSSDKLTPLFRSRSLKQIFLWETPLAKKLACDGANRLLNSAKPILEHILHAQQVGQSWVTEQPRPQSVESEETMHIVQQYKPPDIKLFDSIAEQEMACLFKSTSEVIRREAGDKNCGVHRGFASLTLPFIDGHLSPVMSISETQATDPVLSDVASSDIPPSMDEAMENIQVSKILTGNHLTDSNAALLCLRNALEVPFREVDFNPAHYLTMSKSGSIRVKDSGLGDQEPISSRKDTIYLAQRFIHQAEMDAQAQIPNVLERMRLHLAELDNVLQETLEQPPPFSPPRRMSSVGEYTDSEGMLTFR